MNKNAMLDDIEYGDVFQIADIYNIPASVTIEVDTQCNLRCKHCYIPDHGSDKLQISELDDIFRQLREMGTFEIVLTGGEIFIRDDSVDIVKLARKYGFDVIIFSNATLISEDIARELGNYDVGMFSPSIYSIVDKIHDGITGVDGSLQMTLSGLSYLKKYNVPVEVKTMVMKENCFSLDDIYAYCKNNGFGCVASPYLFCRTDCNKDPIGLRMDSNELKKVMPVVDEIIGFSPQERNADDYMCPTLQHSFGISATGKVFPCNAMFYEVGDIRVNRLDEIWLSEKLSKVKQLRFKDLTKCSGCAISNYCVRCAGIALGETGNMLSDFSFACKIAQIRSRK